MQETYKLLHGDVNDKIKEIEDNSIDSIVTDPPYEMNFMGKSWDNTGIAYSVPMWKECLRVLKPGGHLVSFGGARTYHRMACAIEDAGFEIRDQLMWVYGQGFPKAMDIGKAIDKAAGAKRTCTKEGVVERGGLGEDWDTGSSESRPRYDLPVTEEAKKWDGWKTQLKPAHEPIVLARKPLQGTVVNNVLTYGTGALNIGDSRIGTDAIPSNKLEQWSGFGEKKRPAYTQSMNEGRWPANFIHDGSDEVEAEFAKYGSSPAKKSRTGTRGGVNAVFMSKEIGNNVFQAEDGFWPGDNGGTPSRFFYCAKTNKQDREEGNNHTTVKPTTLMRYLCKLVTPPSGIVLDPFTGSGSTGKADMQEGFQFIGIEKEEEHIAIAERRIGKAMKEMQAA